MELAIATAAVVLGLAIVAALGYRRRWRWTGLPADPGQAEAGRPHQPAKTLWDWLQLLIVPLVLAVAAFGLNAAQADRDHRAEERQAARDLEAARDEARERSLHAYIGQMSDLILERGLRASGPARPAHRTNAQMLARTLTLVALRQMDGRRKALILQFLWELALIRQKSLWVRRSPSDPWEFSGQLTYPIVNLAGADLRGLEMDGMQLSPASAIESSVITDTAAGRSHQTRIGVDLRGTELQGASFRGTNLANATFNEANIRDVDFEGADLAAAVFDQGCLSDSSFRDANLGRETLTPAASVLFAEGQRVDFRGADLDGADLRSSVLSPVRMEGASTKDTRFPEPWTPTGNPDGLRYAPTRCHPPVRPILPGMVGH
jgi:uncharacterized protein YjbI with pentapeptide repeats